MQDPCGFNYTNQITYSASEHDEVASRATLIARFMGHHGAHLGPTGPRWAPYWLHELFYLGFTVGAESEHPWMNDHTYLLVTEALGFIFLRICKQYVAQIEWLVRFNLLKNAWGRQFSSVLAWLVNVLVLEDTGRYIYIYISLRSPSQSLIYTPLSSSVSCVYNIVVCWNVL